MSLFSRLIITGFIFCQLSFFLLIQPSYLFASNVKGFDNFDECSYENIYSMGVKYRDSGDYFTARKYFSHVVISGLLGKIPQNSFDFQKFDNANMLVVSAMHNLGSVSWKEKKYIEALDWFIEANKYHHNTHSNNFIPSLNNIKKIRSRIRITYTDYSAPKLFMGNMVDIVADLYEDRVKYFVDTYAIAPIIGWTQGLDDYSSSGAGEVISADTARRNMLALKNNFCKPLLRLNSVGYISDATDDIGFLKFDFVFFPTAINRPGPVDGFKFHIKRFPFPGEKALASGISKSSTQSIIASYKVKYIHTPLVLFSRAEVEYMNMQSAGIAFFSKVCQMLINVINAFGENLSINETCCGNFHNVSFLCIVWSNLKKIINEVDTENYDRKWAELIINDLKELKNINKLTLHELLTILLHKHTPLSILASDEVLGQAL